MVVSNSVPLQLVLSSDEPVFGGYNNVSKDYDVTYDTDQGNYDERPHSFLVYSTCRTVAVYAPANCCDARADSHPLGIPGLGVIGKGPNFAT